ncbi:1-O-acylceramide synthase precursor, putative [Entamoeba invadens IP1]|uniref:1-O-acylceramide synthase, putative n=2 Tax=Entamoeba invadens TaxID=33085 RepID=A0A0A1U5G6_ENTIV|nr:1-O-acylceramide synthase precursor, putative [Entamoeba invadens IP1]ELP88080.1 1-O-acylceramide synthase precursor, putative [Entamoeba invadens IP1]BAN41933.1 1-O-acylceramide synthase precursor, putative [Entamoeba invadens]|eukprot:XP_004254851.1 1-O-acylceramide synthase precursor, putative [Entamoeba invadens IP1]
MLLLLVSLALSLEVQKTSLKAKDKCASRSPVVMVPGLMSSILEAKIDVAESYGPWPKDCDRTKDWSRVWVDADIVLPRKGECLMKYMSGVWNETTNKLETIPGVSLRVPEFGSTYGLDQLDPVFVIKQFTNSFHKLISHLEKMGYRDQVDMFGATYDWRSADLPSTYYEATKGLIYAGYKNTGKKVVVLSHSMGGFVTYKLLDYLGKEFCDQYIQSWIAVSAPFIGTGMVQKQLSVGENLGLPINEENVRDFSRTLESILALSPLGEKWNNDDMVTIKSTGKTYKASELKDFYKQIPEIASKSDYIINNEMVPFYHKWNYTVPNGVKMGCVHSHGKETPYSITFETEDLNSKSEVVYSDGDKLVNLNSLQSCSLFTNDVTDIGKHGHLLILGSDDLWDYVRPRVCDNSD